ncbi:hypothetical protein HDU81_009481 [Chytriomyces hyalinus]|nr:hypothetical protein HDU81_009481 [Chytriomyces hyalinus]
MCGNEHWDVTGQCNHVTTSSSALYLVPIAPKAFLKEGEKRRRSWIQFTTYFGKEFPKYNVIFFNPTNDTLEYRRRPSEATILFGIEWDEQIITMNEDSVKPRLADAYRIFVDFFK